ncbi:hypothetical protein GCM10027612_14880 [Microbispora bryophytorum subsp. camponoti]
MVHELVGAGLDSRIPRHLIAEMVERMPDAVLVIIAAGHNVHAGRPTEFLAAVNDCLAARVVG